MLGGLSTRRYPLGLEPVGTQVAQAASGTSKSAVSRRFVAMTHTALAELLTRDLSTLDLVWLLIDGVHFAEHTCVVALGIAIDGTKHPLALVEGCPENATWPASCWWAARAWPGGHPADPVRHRRRQGAAPRDHRRVRPPGHRQRPAAQDPQRPRQAAPTPRRPGRAPHAHRLPRPIRPGRRGPAAHLARELDKTHPGAAASLREAWPRPSRSCGWACRRPWPVPCGARTPSSR